MRNQENWARRSDVFKTSAAAFRRKRMDTQALQLTEENADGLAKACGGTVIRAKMKGDEPPTLMIKFMGRLQDQFVFEGEYLIRTILPGDEYFHAMPADKFEKYYEKVSWRENKKEAS